MFKSITEIAHWNDLQEEVKLIFSELGYDAKTDETLILSNGARVNVDVLAVKGSNVLAQKIIVECKFWETSIPRAIVQSLKMDVQEAGANFGIIISKKGFQTGSYEGINLTTVKLLSFEELQENLADEWMDSIFTPLTERVNLLIDYSRNFEYGTVERSTFERFSQVNNELKQLGEQIQRHVQISLAYWKDYCPQNIHSKIEATIQLEGVRSLNIRDTRSFAMEITKLFDDTFSLIESFNCKVENLSKKELEQILS